jgi:hypothetical protein
MKTKVTLAVATALFLAVGCTSTATLGPKANQDSVIGATLSTDKVGLTLPFVRVEAGSTETTTTKKKK